jgi:hypothetical protein
MNDVARHDSLKVARKSRGSRHAMQMQRDAADKVAVR